MRITTTIFTLLIISAKAQTPPAQPASGPGGSDYAHNQVIMSDFTSLLSGDGYWLFEPDQPQPDSADVVVFNHGWGVYNPGPYGAWIEHLVRKGNIVIFPKYEQNDGFFPTQYTPNAATGIEDAFTELNTNPSRVKPRMNHIAMFGHSFGGVITANLAIEFSNYNVPQPQCFMLCEPGPGTSLGHLSSYNNMDQSYHALIIVGADDAVVGNTFGRMIFDDSGIPTSRMNYITQYADSPPVIEATHNEPLAADNSYDGGTIGTVITGGYAASKTDAVDYFCYWKLGDALLNCTFYGTDCEYAFGDTPEQKNMGQWSDGTDVIPLVVEPTTVSTNTIETENQALFPNPTLNTLNLKKKTESLKIYNNQGQLVLSQLKPSTQISLEHLAPGHYIVELSTGNNLNRVKLIKR